jgi:hypothetical protein
MGYVQDEQHDVFISYAHVDNQPLEGMEKGWTTTLVGNLQNFLARKLGSKNVSIWMDRELAGNAPLTPSIMDALRQTATLVVIASPAYMNSEWCSRERETFLKLVRERSRSDSRVFLVEIDKMERRDLPPEFSDLLGYRFWLQDREGKAPRTLAIPNPKPDEPEYWDRLLDLSTDLAQELKKLKTTAQMQPIGSIPSVKGVTQELSVFLAETTDDMEEQREEVKGYLKQAGLRVLPESYYPRDDPAAFQRMMERDLAQCELFVQLLSRIAGRKPTGYAQGYPGLQHDCAVQMNKTILQWRSRDLDVNQVRENDYRHLLEGSTVRAIGLEEFKRAVVEEAVRPTPTPPEKSLDVLVFVNAALSIDDQELAGKVAEWLYNNHGIQYSMLADYKEPARIRENLRMNLQMCDGVVIIYGASSDSAQWVLGQLLQNRRIISERDEPLKALAIFEGPPPEPRRPNLNIRLRNMHIAQCHNGLDDAALDVALRDFVESLRR